MHVLYAGSRILGCLNISTQCISGCSPNSQLGRHKPHAGPGCCRCAIRHFCTTPERLCQCTDLCQFPYTRTGMRTKVLTSASLNWLRLLPQSVCTPAYKLASLDQQWNRRALGTYYKISILKTTEVIFETFTNQKHVTLLLCPSQLPC